MEESQRSIVIKTLPSTRLFLREALDAFALIPNLVKMPAHRHITTGQLVAIAYITNMRKRQGEGEKIVEITPDLFAL